MKIFSFASSMTPNTAFNAAPTVSAGPASVFAGIRTTQSNPFSALSSIRKSNPFAGPAQATASPDACATPRLSFLTQDVFASKTALSGLDLSRAAGRANASLAAFDDVHAQIAGLQPAELQGQVETHLANGSLNDVRSAASILNVAGKTNRLAFGASGTCAEAKFAFRSHLSDAIAALGDSDHVAARLDLQRAMRQVSSFQ